MKLSTLFSRPILLLIAMGCFVAAKADSFDSTTGLLKLNLVTVGSAKYTVQLRLEDDGRLKLISAVPAVYTKSTFSTYDSTSGRLNISVVDSDSDGDGIEDYIEGDRDSDRDGIITTFTGV